MLVPRRVPSQKLNIDSSNDSWKDESPFPLVGCVTVLPWRVDLQGFTIVSPIFVPTKKYLHL